MNSRIQPLLEEIRVLEEELEEILNCQKVNFFYQHYGNKVKFDRAVEKAHRLLKIGLIDWIKNSQPLNVISAPVIYSMIIPFLILDFSVSVYQNVCFPLYRIAKVNRGKYIVVDRHQLHYLNGIEKFNCIYCGYVNGLIGYSREIVARTEQYWCPVKHAKKILDPHRHYIKFAEFGDAREYRRHLKQMRKLIRETHKK